MVTYVDGVIVDESGEAHFASFLPAGEVTDDPWFPGTAFANPTGAEIHLWTTYAVTRDFRLACGGETGSPAKAKRTAQPPALRRVRKSSASSGGGRVPSLLRLSDHPRQ